MKRNTILLSLLTLTLAAAVTLPALAEVVYSGLKELKHLERIPVVKKDDDDSDSDNSAKLSVYINQETIGNLLDGNKSTSWQSWEAPKEEEIQTFDYSSGNYNPTWNLNGLSPQQSGEGYISTIMLDLTRLKF